MNLRYVLKLYSMLVLRNAAGPVGPAVRLRGAPRTSRGAPTWAVNEESRCWELGIVRCKASVAHCGGLVLACIDADF